MAERNIGVLPMNEKYTVLGVDYSDDATCVCENCGRAIKNITEIQNSKGKKFCVGIDCADTLSSAEISNNWEYQDMKKSHNRLLTQLAKVAKTVKTGKFTILFDLSMGLYLYDRPVDVWGIRFLTNDRVF